MTRLKSCLIAMTVVALTLTATACKNFFTVENPNASASCGCGQSFQAEGGEVPAGAGGCVSGCSH